MAELTVKMEQEREKLERTKAAAAQATCIRCKGLLGSKDAPTAAARAVAPVNRTLGDGQYSVVSN